MDVIKEKVLELVQVELDSANRKFPLFSSTHEGYAVLLEEIEEAGDEMGYLREWEKNRGRL